jgi:hypothetical protein
MQLEGIGCEMYVVAGATVPNLHHLRSCGVVVLGTMKCLENVGHPWGN